MDRATFCNCHDFIMRKTYTREKKLPLHRRRGRRHTAVTVTDLDIADDLVILTEAQGGYNA